MTEQLLVWIGFGAFVLAMLALDLGVFHRKSHVVGFTESMAADENQFPFLRSVQSKFISTTPIL